MKQHRPFIQAIEHSYPLSLSGSVLAALALALLVGSLVNKDPYQLVLSIAGLLVLLVLVLLGRVQAAQLAKYPIQWDTSVPLVAGSAPTVQRLTGVDIHPFLWFRLHFVVRGRLTVGRRSSLFVLQESVASSTTGGAMPVTLSFPLCGLLDAVGTLKVSDIFGLTRARFGERIERRLTVIPAPFPEAITVRVEASERSEEKQSQINSDEEKYYMREYAPGDRFRDINWKTSSRLAQLFTRIAPIALEQTKIIAVAFRNFAPDRPESIDSIAHLNHAKSWLLTFLRAVKESNPDFQFVVTTGRGTTRIASAEEIERFALEVGELSYQSEPSANGAPVQTNEIYVFTTPFDRALPRYLSELPHARINLFRTLMAPSAAAGATEGARRERPRMVQRAPGATEGARRERPRMVQRAPGAGSAAWASGPAERAAPRTARGASGREGPNDRSAPQPSAPLAGGGPTVRRLSVASFRGQLPLPGIWAFRRESGVARAGWLTGRAGSLAGRAERGWSASAVADPRVRILGQEIVEPHVLSFS